MTLSRRRRANTGRIPRLSYFPEHKQNIDFQLNEFFDISFQFKGLALLSRASFHTPSLSKIHSLNKTVALGYSKRRIRRSERATSRTRAGTPHEWDNYLKARR
ncbi:hypothetical protein L2E82_30838 [Cichorium intybus]|uniref:Uncharacterized protein n=1 Tax=Cichorium intybus TaxID=13427 RepID=A0ACB9D1E4_CICIN|nr:hypothetical protein L2E82_30838 [Cichorium intybus]